MKKLIISIFMLADFLSACQHSAVPTNIPVQPTISPTFLPVQPSITPTVIPIQNIVAVLLANDFVRYSSLESLCAPCQVYTYDPYWTTVTVYTDSSIEITVDLSFGSYFAQGETLATILEAIYPNKLGTDMGNSIRQIEVNVSPHISTMSSTKMIFDTEDNYDYLIYVSSYKDQQMLILIHPHTPSLPYQITEFQ
jgi:hypothetical protein